MGRCWVYLFHPKLHNRKHYPRPLCSHHVRNTMKKLLAILILMLMPALVGASCTGRDPAKPYIREEPGKEACPTFCEHALDLGVTKQDKECFQYLGDMDAGAEAAVAECTKWCTETQENSVQLNPPCMAKVSTCSQIDCASRIDPTNCVNLDEVCK